ncbi:MAG: hypothetical protein MHM6MM_006560 [Cercozoa sp. M6MM]
MVELLHAETPSDVDRAASLLAHQQVVAFPTETVYGLGADARSDDAVSKVFRAKGRPSDNPLIVHVASRDMVDELVQSDAVTPLVNRLMNAFWPGPLTLILPVRPGVLSTLVTAGLNTVGVRVPGHPVALQLLSLSHVPVAAPSANTSGRPSPTLARHVAADLGHSEHVSAILNGGATGVGVESTVIRVTDETITILRPGGVTREQLSQYATVTVDPGLLDQGETPMSPGMKYTHYAPRAPVTVLQGDAAFVRRCTQEALQEARGKVALLKMDTLGVSLDDDGTKRLHVLSLGATVDDMARLLYARLRECDDLGVEVILAQDCVNEGVGSAVRNRLLKAAAGCRRQSSK